MTRRLLATATLFGVLAVACGKVGPPVRVRSEPAATESSESAEETSASTAEEAEGEEEQP